MCARNHGLWVDAYNEFVPLQAVIVGDRLLHSRPRALAHAIIDPPTTRRSDFFAVASAFLVPVDRNVAHGSRLVKLNDDVLTSVLERQASPARLVLVVGCGGEPDSQSTVTQDGVTSCTACTQAEPRTSQAAPSPKRVWHGLLVSRVEVGVARLEGL